MENVTRTGTINLRYRRNVPPVIAVSLPVLKKFIGNTNPLKIKKIYTQSCPAYNTLTGVVLVQSGGKYFSVLSSISFFV